MHIYIVEANTQTDKRMYLLHRHGRGSRYLPERRCLRFTNVLPGFGRVRSISSNHSSNSSRTAATRVALVAAMLSSAATSTTAARNSNDSTESKAKPQEPPRCLVSFYPQDVV